MLQGRKSLYHRSFRTARTGAGFSFRDPNFIFKISIVGKGNGVLQQRKTAENRYQTPQKKAVLIKNCFVYLRSKNDNCHCEEEARRRSNLFYRLSLLAFQDQQMLSYCAFDLYL